MCMQVIAVIAPVVIFIVFYIRRRNVYDLHHAILGNFNFLSTVLHCQCDIVMFPFVIVLVVLGFQKGNKLCAHCITW
jgi:hypothetical protein